MAKDIRKWIKSCATCQKWNSKRIHRAPLQPLPVVSEPWSKIAVDVVGPLNRTKAGHRYILTVLDFGTRYPEAIPLKRVDAKTTADKLVETFARYGIPQEILSDNGSNFVAGLTEELLRRLKCFHIKSSPYHPQSNGMVERLHHVLKTVLEKTRNGDQQWDLWLPSVLASLRDSVHTSTGYTPFQLMFGRDARSPVSALREKWTSEQKLPKAVDTYLTELTTRMVDAQEIVQETDSRAKEKSKKYYDRKTVEDSLSVGEEVLFMSPTGTAGLVAAWEGPYTVLEKKGPLTYLIDAPCRGKGEDCP